MNRSSVFLIALLAGFVPVVADAQATAAGQEFTSATTHDGSHRQLTLSNLCVEAQSSISAALGRDIRGYQAHAQKASFQAENARHKLVVNFTTEGVAVHSGSALWSVALEGYGYGNALKTVDSVAPRADFNRVEYRRGSLTEWYVNGPQGLEQGFTLNEPPGRSANQPLTIAMALSGDFTGMANGDRTILSLTSREQNAELR